MSNTNNIVSAELLLELQDDIFKRAKFFIDDMGLFAPFGSKLIDSEIKPVVIMDDSEDILNVITALKNNFSEEIKSNLIQAGAIAYDVTIDRIATGKIDALCLILSTDGENWSEDNYPYRIVNGECVWGLGS